MKNSLGREVINGFKPFVSSDDYKNHLGEYKKIKEKELSGEVIFLKDLDELFK